MDNLGELVNRCKDDNAEKSELIDRYSPFIFNTVYEKIGMQDEDMLQIARIAFCEAIDNYSQQKGNFINFAEILINNRINDELRKRYKRQDVIFAEDTEDARLLHKESIRDYNEMLQVQQRKYEINEYLKELLKWGYRIETLEDYCPKHQDTRIMCRCVARILFQNLELKETILKTRQLPVKKLAKTTLYKTRFIEKHSKYITMIFIALNGSYDIIQEYLGGDSHERYQTKDK